MNEARLRELLQILAESGIDEFELEHSFWRGTRVRVVRRARQVLPVPPAAADAAPRQPEPEAAAPPPAEELHAITSPMVGTFFRSSSPDAEPFVSEGARVRAGQTVCIIEAMKIMNEIPADVDGEVVEVLVGGGKPVEFGQPLFRIRPS